MLKIPRCALCAYKYKHKKYKYEHTAHTQYTGHEVTEIYPMLIEIYEATRSLLENSKGATRLFDDAGQNNMLVAAKSVANETNKLVGAAKSQVIYSW